MRCARHTAVNLVLLIAFLGLSACEPQTATSLPSDAAMMLNTPGETVDLSATQSANLNQQKITSDSQMAATAEIVRANAQATLNSANATLGAAQTQQQNKSDVIAAQIAGTAQIVQANAQATLNSAGLTQSSAMTQSQFNMLATVAMSTQNELDAAVQQNKDDLAAATGTASANNIATQTQAAVATSQWYADQARERDELRQKPIALLLMWCLPVFIILLAGLVLWGFWRFLKIQQNNQRILENPINKLPGAQAQLIHHHHDDGTTYIESDVIDSQYQVTEPDDQVHRWLDEVKSKLQNGDQKDTDDSTDNRPT